MQVAQGDDFKLAFGVSNVVVTDVMPLAVESRLRGEKNPHC